MSRVLVVGAGALGGLLGALLHEAKHDVVLLSRSATPGIRLEGDAYGPARDVAVRIETATPAGWSPELVVLAVKTQDVGSALAQHAKTFGAAPVVALQNGLAQDDLVARACGSRRAVAAIAAVDAQHLKPGVIDCARRGSLVLGAARPDAVGSATFAARILESAIEIHRTGDAWGARWTKLLVNLGNVVPAITGLSFQETSRHPLLARAHVRLLKEGLEVANAEGAKLQPLPWTSPLLLKLSGMAPEKLAARIYAKRVAKVLGETPGYGSTWQSRERGRSIETEWLNGEIVRRGRARELPTPTNDAALRLANEGARLAADEAGAALLGAITPRSTPSREKL